MTVDALWAELSVCAIQHTTIFRYGLWRWDFITVSETEFLKFEQFFQNQTVVAWNRFENLRSRHWYRHLHAVRQAPGEVSIHMDRFNPTTHWLFSVPHGLTDVVPYFLWCLLTWTRPYTI